MTDIMIYIQNDRQLGRMMDRMTYDSARDIQIDRMIHRMIERQTKNERYRQKEYTDQEKMTD